MDVGGADHRQRHSDEEAPLCLLLAPHVEAVSDHVVTTAGLYRWDESQPDDADLVHAMDDGGCYCSFRPWREVAHDMAHCDGLVLLPGGEATTAARVLNPATGRVLTLPVGFRSGGRQAFGLGRDPSSGAYKVARFFYRSSVEDAAAAGALGMEVLTIGMTAGQQQQWRETAAPPPYPVIPGRTATFFKGSLLWTPKQDSYYGDPAPGLVRFSLDDADADEPFSITPPPPCAPRVDYAASSLAVLRGELFFAQPGPEYHDTSLELWVYRDDNGGGRYWERRYVVTGLPLSPGDRWVRLVTAYGEVIVIQAGPRFLHRYNCRTQRRAFAVSTDFVLLGHLRYRHPDDDDAAAGGGSLHEKYSARSLSLRSHRLYEFDVIPYVPSLSAPL